VLTNDSDLAKRAKHISTTAKQPHRFEFYHDEIGYDYRLPNINAALGCAQLEMLPSFLKSKRALASRYQVAFEGNPVADFLQEPSGAQSNYWLNALILKTPNRSFVEAFMQEALSHGYGLRGLWTPMNQLPMFAACPTMDLTHTQRLFDSIISLPSGPRLGKAYV